MFDCTCRGILGCKRYGVDLGDTEGLGEGLGEGKRDPRLIENDTNEPTRTYPGGVVLKSVHSYHQ